MYTYTRLHSYIRTRYIRPFWKLPRTHLIQSFVIILIPTFIVTILIKCTGQTIRCVFTTVESTWCRYTYMYIHTHMRIYMYIYIYMYTCICIRVYTYMYIYTYIGIYTHIYIYTYIYTYMYIHAYMYVYVCECMCACVCVRERERACVCECVCVYVHIYTYENPQIHTQTDGLYVHIQNVHMFNIFPSRIELLLSKTDSGYPRQEGKGEKKSGNMLFLFLWGRNPDLVTYLVPGNCPELESTYLSEYPLVENRKHWS